MLVVVLHSMNFVFGYDPMNLVFISTELVSIDLWSFVHAFTFAGLGFIHPSRPGLFLLFGIVWEALEYIACVANVMGVQAVWNERVTNTVWDVWFNSVGYWLGEVAVAVWINYRRKQKSRSKIS